jgi:hypothetical protein
VINRPTSSACQSVYVHMANDKSPHKPGSAY